MKKYVKDGDLAAAREARALAKERRQVTFEGKYCPRCGWREKYTSNGACVCCANKRTPERLAAVGARREASDAREYAEIKGLVTYNRPEPCKKCGTHSRYTANAACVECSKIRVRNMRAIRAELWHSTTSPIVWVNQPPSPETAALYAMCPSLAAYAGQWTAVYSDAQHLSPGARIFPGCDVLKRPAALQMMLNDRNHPGHAIAIHLAPAYYAALRAYNDKVCRRV